MNEDTEGALINICKALKRRADLLGGGLSALQEIFQQFDLNNDGRVSRAEFGRACAHLGLSLAQDELQLLLEHLDATGSDAVDYGAFCAFATSDGDIVTMPMADHMWQAACEALELQVVNDPSNADPRFTRNRIRHEVLPLLADVAGRDPVPLLARHATLAGEATGLLADLVTDVDPTDVKSVADLPDDLVRLAVRRWLTGQVPGPPPDQASVDRVLDVVRGRAVATEVAGGHRVSRSAGFLLFESR